MIRVHFPDELFEYVNTFKDFIQIRDSDGVHYDIPKNCIIRHVELLQDLDNEIEFSRSGETYTKLAGAKVGDNYHVMCVRHKDQSHVFVWPGDIEVELKAPTQIN